MTGSEAALRSVATPEGVPVAVELADHGARAGALLIDLAIIVGSLVVAALLAVLLMPVAGTVAVMLVSALSFLLRAPYFMAFEMRWRGQTPGKRVFKLRVVDRHGGALSPQAVAARNVMREVEVFMPMQLVLIAPSTAINPGTLWIVAALVWLGIFTLMPLFNRDRLRIGDMIAGTWVVRAQGVILQRDLTSPSPADAPRYRFTRTELDVYGIAELQTLEKLLRGPRAPGTNAARTEVFKRIRNKIGWDRSDGAVDPDAFLNDYYRALRAYLEQHVLFGDRRADKHEAAGRRRTRTPASGA